MCGGAAQRNLVGSLLGAVRQYQATNLRQNTIRQSGVSRAQPRQISRIAAEINQPLTMHPANITAGGANNSFEVAWRVRLRPDNPMTRTPTDFHCMEFEQDAGPVNHQ